MAHFQTPVNGCTLQPYTSSGGHIIEQVEVQAVISSASDARAEETHIWVFSHILCVLDPHGQYTAKVLIPEYCEAPDLHRRTDNSVTLVSQRKVVLLNPSVHC